MINCKLHIDESKQQLKENGLKITQARLSLLDVFKHSKKPLSIKEVAHHFNPSSVDPVTLYRNVESLQGLGIVKKIHLKDREVYYELAEGEHHHHLVCTNCGKLEDIKVEEMHLDKSFLKRHGFSKVTDHSLEFFGLCIKCSK